MMNQPPSLRHETEAREPMEFVAFWLSEGKTNQLRIFEHMKIKQILVMAIMAIVGIGSANASNTFSTGDVLFGITSSTATLAYTYNLNLGSISNLISLSSGQTKTWTLSTSDLTAIVGSGWDDSTKVSWGVASATLSNLWATASTTLTAGSLSTNDQAISGAKNSLANVIAEYQNGTATTNDGASANIVGAVEYAKADQYSWYNQAKSNLGDSLNYTITKSLNSADTSVLALWQYSTDGTATEAGTFTLSDSGVLTYTSLAAVPEPSTYAMIGIGGLAMLRMFRRRRSA